MKPYGCNPKLPDFSQIDYRGTPKETDTWEVVAKSVVTGILMLVAIVGNFLIIFIVSMSKKMRTTINFYIVNMAIADLFMVVCPFWIHVTVDVTEGWILGAFMCKFNAFVQVSAFSAISFTMMAIAGDRFFAIVFPLRARVTQRKAKVVVCVVWILAFVVGIPPALYFKYDERRWKNHLERICNERWPMSEDSEGNCDAGAPAERLYWTVVLVLLNWVPMLVMGGVYSTIIHRLRCSRMTQATSSNLTEVQQKTTRKVIKMLICLLITFMVCTIPFQASTLYENYKSKKTTLPDWYAHHFFSAVLLMYTHSCANPIIYGAMNQSFRQGFKDMVAKIKRNTNSTWESRMTQLDSIRPNTTSVNTVDNSKFDTSGATVDHMVGSNAYVNKAMLVD